MIEKFRQKMKGWRTILFGGLVAAAGTVTDLLDALKAIDIAPLLPPAHALKIIAALGVVTVLLRLVTTGRVGRKDF
ncbi:MAG: hypothetical protein KJZ73_13535 [Pseudorhodoplanes sp.]|nr:hypothetical protein [Pseudorhodoplanes sp.]MBW7949870.1 hypothetical protein [Pseudorhodoplanes sp.]MCL4712257.1 hypothetical protein [Pseudorhodoplanes sp.]MCQ3943356.1 hypothetical protein [Alphaproteobacteria bacterium]GIK80842.1 MAG: hypothetical protein BroJett024_19470 [Alphaproteobacteria bacterium]